jgi:DNA modification methylase
MRILCGDSVRLPLEDDAADLVFFSPPYEDAREYGDLNFDLRGQKWVDWLVPRYREAARVSKGIVACVVNGRTRNYEWSGTPFKLWLALHDAGLHMRKPLIFERDGIFGSGSKDWFKDNYEFIICGSKHAGRLETINQTAMGHPPKFRPGGAPSYRTASGERVKRTKPYTPPKLANPGNVIHCLVGGGHMGHKLAHENEAPFPEYLAEWCIRSMSRPGGMVVDIMAGSGTTLAVAHKHGRDAIGVDVRMSQCELMQRRMREECGIKVDITHGLVLNGEAAEVAVLPVVSPASTILPAMTFCAPALDAALAEVE